MNPHKFYQKYGVHFSSIYEAIESGRLKAIKNQDGQYEIDEQEAKFVFKSRIAEPLIYGGDEIQDIDPNNISNEDQARISRANDYANAIKNINLAKMRLLELDQKQNKLVPKENVYSAGFNIGRMLSQSFQNMADQLAPVLAKETDEVKCYEILMTAIKEIQDDFTRNVRDTKL